jgi:membrane-bound lytic murein transglycosylase D
VAFSNLRFYQTIKILGAVYSILLFNGCITPPISETSHDNPEYESLRNFSPSADPEPGDGFEKRNEAVAAVPAAADLPASTDEAEEIIPSDTPAKESDSLKSDSLNSTGDHRSEALQRVLSLCKQSQIEWKQGELERAIETLDQAYALLLKVNPLNNSSLFQEKEDLRIVISRRMLEIYSSRLVVANGKSRNEIPIIINRHVQAEIDAFTTGRERDFFISAYRRSGRYRAKIEAALQTAGLPIELAWLPLVESGFKVTALSPARALGLWQFIPSTGYRYNLSRDRYIDERLDAMKSTRGAIEYLKELHAMFGDWTTVLAAFNCGEHRVIRTIQSQSINYLDNFWDLYERLPRETARYVPRFLATLHIVQNLEKFSLNDIEVDPELQFESTAVFRQTSLSSIARMTGIDAELLKELNADLRLGILPPEGFDLRVPLGSAGLVASCTSDFPIHSVRSDRTAERHKVRKGETFSSIGKRYRVSAKRLMAANDVCSAKRLKAGDVLRIPGDAAPSGRAIAAGSPSPASKAIEYVVRPGDSLYKIAKRFGTTTERIQRLNRMSTTSLSVGQILRIQPLV